MSNRRFTLTIFFFLILFNSCSLRSLSAIQRDELVILFTNDVHGNIRASKSRRSSSDTASLIGGTASLATFYSRWAEKVGGHDNLLILDAGDYFQGTPEGNESKGHLMIELMNRLGYDAATLGNHEFDFGFDNMKELINTAKFPIMADNLRSRVTGGLPAELSPPIIIEQNGIKIGIAGIITDELLRVTNLDSDAEWFVERELPNAQRAVWELKNRGAEIIILLTHCGFEHDSEIAAAYDSNLPSESGTIRIDMIIGGHSHTRLPSPVIVNGVRIVQTGGKGVEPGEIRIRWDRQLRQIRAFDYKLVELRHEVFPEDEETRKFLEPKFSEIDRSMNRVVGRALAPFKRRSNTGISSPLGNHQADIMREYARADIGIMNKGGIRSDISEGEISLRALYSVSPFGNTICSVKLTGAQILSLLEKALDGKHTTFEISGMKVTYDPDKPAGSKIMEVVISGSKLERNRLYSVATNSFLFAGGDAYREFVEGLEGYDSGRTLLEAEVEFFEKHSGGVAPVSEERWILRNKR